MKKIETKMKSVTNYHQCHILQYLDEIMAIHQHCLIGKKKKILILIRSIKMDVLSKYLYEQKCKY